jgi:uncharacterized membrane protein YeaQ/YmgE (transglycosylase-associated protein family)
MHQLKSFKNILLHLDLIQQHYLYFLTTKLGIMHLLWVLIIGAFVGWLAGQIMRGSGYGILMDIVIGIVGSWLGSWIFGMLGIGTSNSLLAQIITGVVGALVLMWIVSLISGRKK